MHAKSIQSCPTLCNPVDCSLPGSSVHGILQARILEWVAVSFSRGSSPPWDRTLVFCVSCIGRQTLYHQHHLGKPIYIRLCCCLVTSVMSDSVGPCGLPPARLLYAWDSPGKSSRIGCHTLLQEIFLIQGLNLGLLHCRQILYCCVTREAHLYLRINFYSYSDSFPV